MLPIFDMSYRTTVFRWLVNHPLLTYRFSIAIPGLKDVEVIIESTSYPQPSFDEIDVSMRGRKIHIPTLLKCSGDWSFTIPEEVLGTYGISLQTSMISQLKMIAYYKQGIKKFNIGITPIAYNDVPLLTLKETLVGCWIKGIEDVSLSSSNVDKPWKWNVKVRYDFIEPSISVGQYMKVLNQANKLLNKVGL